jgi:hypothetical protein
MFQYLEVVTSVFHLVPVPSIYLRKVANLVGDESIWKFLCDTVTNYSHCAVRSHVPLNV